MKKIISVLTTALVTQGFSLVNYVPEVQANPVIEIAQNSTNSNLIQQGLALLKKKNIQKLVMYSFKLILKMPQLGITLD